jgi:carboxymethylenebutenolidase
MGRRWDTLEVDGSKMRCYLNLPEQTPAAGVLVCMHAPGVDDFIQGICDRLASQGLAAIAPDLYHRQTEPEENPLKRMANLEDVEIITDLGAAVAHLRGLEEVDAARVAAIGFCMGGRLVYVQASEDETLDAAVVFYGGNAFTAWGDGPTPFQRLGHIKCPILGLFGEDDQNPSPDDVQRIDAELSRLNIPHDFHTYPGAGHAFLNDARPSYRAEAAADAWRRCVGFLNEHLQQ